MPNAAFADIANQEAALLEGLGERLRLARRRRKMTAHQVAVEAGITRVTLRRVEAGEPGVLMGTYLRVSCRRRRALLGSAEIHSARDWRGLPLSHAIDDGVRIRSVQSRFARMSRAFHSARDHSSALAGQCRSWSGFCAKDLRHRFAHALLVRRRWLGCAEPGDVHAHQ